MSCSVIGALSVGCGVRGGSDGPIATGRAEAAPRGFPAFRPFPEIHPYGWRAGGRKAGAPGAGTEVDARSGAGTARRGTPGVT
ncbi:hypothetical protein Kpho02_39350 [Kitasatospora phosalacinea]|uniref:Uncharacterized protein n=1 Tax=Kitasatospora phosalacinea TaxID=2065 RepID=A0A9W6QAA0_9ACTN|nr:hypothetical protein Kpho02_39350 [Kitasatospora phosalacinea]